MTPKRSLRVLFVEDSDDDAALVERQLRNYGFDLVVERVETAESLSASLDRVSWDLLILDYSLPRLDAQKALALLKARGLDVATIVVSGAVGEERAVEAMRAGAGDFIRKDNLARLGPAVERELQEAENRRERARLLDEQAAERNWLHAVIEDSPVGIVRVEDAGGRRAVANRRAEDLFGKSLPPEGGIAQYVGKIFRPDGTVLPFDGLAVSRALKGEKVAPEEQVLRRPDGREVHVLVSAGPIRIRETTVGAVVAYEDITRLHELEQLRDEWNSLVVHDLRQPITAIVGQAGFLQRYYTNELGERGARIVEGLLSATRTIDRMVGDLLDSSRIETRRLQLAPETIDLGVLARDVVDRLSTSATNHRLRVDIAEPIPPLVADPTRIAQVIGNLVSNAAKYGEAGTEIRVEAAARDCVVEVAVSNRGVGIAPEDLPRLFTRFYRTDQARTGGVEGLGLGLYISRGLIEAHGGRIWAESIPGQVTTFRFRLPITSSERNPGLSDR